MKMHFNQRFIFCLICLIGSVCLGERSPKTITDIVIPHVEVKDATFKDALSLVKFYLKKNDLRMVNDKVNDVPANYDNARTLTLDEKNMTISELLTSFCSYYGLQWSLSKNTVILSLPRPR